MLNNKNKHPLPPKQKSPSTTAWGQENQLLSNLLLWLSPKQKEVKLWELYLPPHPPDLSHHGGQEAQLWGYSEDQVQVHSFKKPGRLSSLSFFCPSSPYLQTVFTQCPNRFQQWSQHSPPPPPSLTHSLQTATTRSSRQGRWASGRGSGVTGINLTDIKGWVVVADWLLLAGVELLCMHNKCF